MSSELLRMLREEMETCRGHIQREKDHIDKLEDQAARNTEHLEGARERLAAYRVLLAEKRALVERYERADMEEQGDDMDAFIAELVEEIPVEEPDETAG